MSLIKGPFTLKWGDNTIEDVEEVSVEYERSSDDFETVQGTIRTVDGSQKASVTLVLLASDIPTLSAVLPQNFVANGDTMSTGETVNNANGAIDLAPASCSISEVYNNLDIISCANPAQVMRLVNARTKVDSIEIDGKIMKVSVMFIGEPESGEASLQWFISGTISVVS